tara:strand:+ start:13222 stop:14208 length:987 start_codon:yes stop_codon:yes gene_type:complete
MTGIPMFDVVVCKKKQEAENIYSFELKLPEQGCLPEFQAGAHIDVEVRPGLIRQYSLCNPAGKTDRYLIAVLNDPASRGGSVGMIEQVLEGQTIRISKPRNLFPLDENTGFTLLLAGGVGITPIIAMAEQLQQLGRDFELHYCGRSRTSMAFIDRLRHSPFAAKVILHCDDGDAKQKLNLDTVFGATPEDSHLYICGPVGFMDYVLGQATDSGWPEARLHREYFSAPDVASADTADDEEAESFTLRLARSGKELKVAADQSVANVLLDNGIEVPISCEQGICGTCLTPVLEGIPDHRDYFMTAKEHALNNQFTPCCSRSKSSVLVIDL